MEFVEGKAQIDVQILVNISSSGCFHEWKHGERERERALTAIADAARPARSLGSFR